MHVCVMEERFNREDWEMEGMRIQQVVSTCRGWGNDRKMLKKWDREGIIYFSIYIY